MAIKTEVDTRPEQKGAGKLGWFMSLTLIVTSPSREGGPAGTRKGRVGWLIGVVDVVAAASAAVSHEEWTTGL